MPSLSASPSSERTQERAIDSASEIILISGKDPSREQGGHSSYVRAHARALIRLGFRPQIFCVGPDDRVVEMEWGTLHEIATSVTPYRPIAIQSHGPRLARAITAYLAGKGRGPHVLHTFGFWYGVSQEISRQLKTLGVETIDLCHSYSTFKHEYFAKFRGALNGLRLRTTARNLAEYALVLYLRRRERAQLRSASAVLVNYKSVERIIASEYGADIACRKIAYCADKAFESQPPAAVEKVRGLDAFRFPNAPLIVAVSRHDPRKGVDYLIRALALLRDRGVEFRACLVGGGPMTKAYHRLSDRLGLDGLVVITGWVDDPGCYLKKADIFVLPSLEEGSGSVSVLEALQAGLPVVATNIDGLPEDVGDNEGVLVEPGDSKGLADALQLLLGDPEMRRRLGRGARARYENSFSAEALTDAMAAVYADLGIRATSDGRR